MTLLERTEEVLKKTKHWNIVVVGCGGTGSNLVPHLAQLIYSLQNAPEIHDRYSLTLVDEDIVEKNNVGRQLFIQNEVGELKAATLQMRYSTAFDLNISYYPHYITEEEMLVKLLLNEEKAMPIIIGCVDNHFSRQIIDKVFHLDKVPDLIYLDAGNSLYSGQVVMGLKYQNEILLKPIAEYYPDVLTTKDEIAIGGTCSKDVVKEPQTLIANLWAATNLLSFLSNILLEKKVPAYMTSFNAHNMLVRPEYIK